MTGPTTPARCEPPDTTKGGWHWVQLGAAKPVPKHWHGYHQGWEGIGVPYADGDVSAAIGYRYHSPVATPAEVDALRLANDRHEGNEKAAMKALDDAQAEIEALRAEVKRAGIECGDAMAQVATLRARVAKSDAMQDSAFIAGMTAGWNFAMCGDHAGMMHARSNREGYLAALKGKIHD